MIHARITGTGSYAPKKVITNHDLEKAVREERFRQDLYQRLNQFTVVIPPLRERPADVELLLEEPVPYRATGGFVCTR